MGAAKISKPEIIQGWPWYDPKKGYPDDHRDVVALMRKPVWIEASKRMELMECMEVIHREGNGAFFYEGRPIPPKNVLKWTEIPDGWQE